MYTMIYYAGALSGNGDGFIGTGPRSDDDDASLRVSHPRPWSTTLVGVTCQNAILSDVCAAAF